MLARLVSLGFLFLVGCVEPAGTNHHDPEEQTANLGQAFDPATTGTIHGQVIWNGEIPVAEHSLIRSLSSNGSSTRSPLQCIMPHYPRVDARERGLEGTVVYLRGIDTSRAKPWRHAPVRVEFHDRQLKVVQGGTPKAAGIVQRGAAIEVVNRDDEYHNLHGRGAAFLAMPLVTKNEVVRRALAKTGVVDMTCGVGYYWMHAHLFVTDHPYFSLTDAQGRFTLDQVPDGRYELTCWMPSWRVVRQERDPEMAILTRLVWAEPREQTQVVEVRRGASTEAVYQWSQALFADSRP
jgi:hypothetical protein